MSDVEKRNQKSLKIVVSISAVILLAIIIMALLGVFNVDNRTDEEKLIDSAIKTGLFDSKTVTSLIEIADIEIEGLDGMEAQVMKRVLQDLDLEVIVSQEASTNTFDLDFSLGLNGISILEGEIFVNGEVMAVYVPTLYDKVIYGHVGQMENLLSGMTDMAMEMPTMSDSQKAAHEEIFEDIETKLLERDYEKIDQLNFVGYYDVIVAFIESISLEEMTLIEEDDESLMQYQLEGGIMNLIALFNDLKEVYDADEALQDTLAAHTEDMDHDASGLGDMDFALDNSLDGLEEIALTLEVFVDESEVVSGANTTIAFPIAGIEGLLDYPMDVVLSCESDIEISETPLDIEAPELDGGVDITALDEAGMKEFFEELKTSIGVNLNENQSFQMLGLDTDLIIEQLFGE